MVDSKSQRQRDDAIKQGNDKSRTLTFYVLCFLKVFDFYVLC